MVREGCAALKFLEDLLYDGSHVLRHTGVGMAVRQMIRTTDIATIAESLLMSVSMVVHYSQSVEDRLKKTQIPLFLRAEIPPTEEIVNHVDSDDETDREEDDEEPQPRIITPNRSVSRPRITRTRTTNPTRTRRQARRADSGSEQRVVGLSNLSTEERNAIRDANADLRRRNAAAEKERAAARRRALAAERRLLQSQPC
eukprot:GILI01044512.1.p1 GENE.GILI01044512.1~~GILI01044512.1.p1  ORF type:complete len:213 (+),score=4.05 GILI01044512.1:45-641(+)